MRGVQKCPRNKTIQEIERNLKKQHRGFSQSIRKHKKEIRQSKPSQMRPESFRPNFSPKVWPKNKSVQIMMKAPPGIYSKTKHKKRKKLDHPCLLCCGPKVLVLSFSPKTSQIWHENKKFLKFFLKTPRIYPSYNKCV